jgi:hypothetical protein
MRRYTAVLQRWGKRDAADYSAADRALRDEASAAASLRRLRRDLNVRALMIEHVRDRGALLMVLTMGMFLMSTTVNVQEFWAGDSGSRLLQFVTWFIEPAITVGWVVLMWMERVASANGEVPEGWVRVGRWAALAATYTFNTWNSWFPEVGELSPKQVVMHSTIPILVFCFAEALIRIHNSLTLAAESVSLDAVEVTVETTELPPIAPEKPAEMPVAPESEIEPVVPQEPDEPVATVVPDQVVTPMRPKGWKRHTRLPEVLRELRAQGKTLDAITTAQVDEAIPANKYVSRDMLAEAWAAIEREEADDGVVNE